MRPEEVRARALACGMVPPLVVIGVRSPDGVVHVQDEGQCPQRTAREPAWEEDLGTLCAECSWDEALVAEKGSERGFVGLEVLTKAHEGIAAEVIDLRSCERVHRGAEVLQAASGRSEEVSAARAAVAAYVASHVEELEVSELEALARRVTAQAQDVAEELASAEALAALEDARARLVADAAAERRPVVVDIALEWSEFDGLLGVHVEASASAKGVMLTSSAMALVLRYYHGCQVREVVDLDEALTAQELEALAVIHDHEVRPLAVSIEMARAL
jgi:hypothetical protein